MEEEEGESGEAGTLSVAFVEKTPHVSRPMRFKPMLFKDQLYISVFFIHLIFNE